jgi:hypothetical protein
VTVTTHKLNEFATCPACGKQADGATSTHGRKPRFHDIAVCGYCSAINTYRHDLTLRAVTPMEIDALPRALKEELARFTSISLLGRSMRKK